MEFADLTNDNKLSAITAIITLTGIIITSILLFTQIRRATKANDLSAAAIQAGIMISFDAQFYSKRLRECRVLTSTFLLAQRKLPVNSDTVEQWDVVSDLIDFFQGIATFTRSGSLPKELVYKNYYYWLSFYYPSCREYIKYYQKKALVYADDTDWLFQELTIIDNDLNKGAYTNHSDKDYNDFFEWEISNMANYNHFDS